MSKLLYAALTATAIGICAAPALAAQAKPIHHHTNAPMNLLDPRPPMVVGFSSGVGVGVGATQGVFGGTAAAGVAALGGVAGIGGLALADSVLQPCRGFQAIFHINHLRGIECYDGKPVVE